LIFQKFSTTAIKKIPASSPAPTYETARVVKVTDGDSIELSTGENIRYIGINSPELESNECFAAESAKANSDLVLGKTVSLVRDISETDKYGRSLYYVYVGDIFVNDYLLKNGFAKVMTVPPDVKFEDEFVSSEAYAKANALGLWGKCSN